MNLDRTISLSPEQVDRLRIAKAQQRSHTLAHQMLGVVLDKVAEADRATLGELLADVYLPEGVNIWLTARHKQFGGLTVDQMEAAGRMDEVLAAVEILTTGAFS